MDASLELLGALLLVRARWLSYFFLVLMEICRSKGHIVPEARLGGPIALVQDGDKIVIDSEKRTIDWDVSEEEEARRRKEWESSGLGTLTVKRGILLRYARDVEVSKSESLDRG
jgi:hypothetical protein